jgi:hypothetical protein
MNKEERKEKEENRKKESKEERKEVSSIIPPGFILSSKEIIQKISKLPCSGKCGRRVCVKEGEGKYIYRVNERCCRSCKEGKDKHDSHCQFQPILTNEKYRIAGVFGSSAIDLIPQIKADRVIDNPFQLPDVFSFGNDWRLKCGG